MRAMRFERPGAPLSCVQLADPVPGPGQVLIRVAACAVCRTDLHLVDGELADARAGVIPGHEIVGRVAARGPGAARFPIGARVGVPWLGQACGTCRFCCAGRENLCEQARFTGCQIDGGYAELAVADEKFCLPIPDAYSDAEAAPLLCAGLIGLRALRMAGQGRRLGLYGFGAAAHIVIQVALHEGREIFAFTRPGDAAAQDFARGLGALWAGDSDRLPPEPLDAAILFAPVGGLVPAALRAVDRGGIVVCAGIHMSDIPAFPYSILWQERVVRSVANLTRADGLAFMALAPGVPVRTHVETLPLEEANRALARLRRGEVEGALVLVP
jgi:propanol-preferring alcohol dehydrogenase